MNWIILSLEGYKAMVEFDEFEPIKVASSIGVHQVGNFNKAPVYLSPYINSCAFQVDGVIQYLM